MSEKLKPLPLDVFNSASLRAQELCAQPDVSRFPKFAAFMVLAEKVCKKAPGDYGIAGAGEDEDKAAPQMMRVMANLIDHAYGISDAKKDEIMVATAMTFSMRGTEIARIYENTDSYMQAGRLIQRQVMNVCAGKNETLQNLIEDVSPPGKIEAIMTLTAIQIASGVLRNAQEGFSVEEVVFTVSPAKDDLDTLMKAHEKDEKLVSLGKTVWADARSVISEKLYEKFENESTDALFATPSGAKNKKQMLN